MMQFADAQDQEKGAYIKVVGVGGGGGNAVSSMASAGLQGIELITANTDMQALAASQADYRLQLGAHSTKGLGAGADPNVGRKAAQEDRKAIMQMLQGADMVFVTAGMGGGTGTGAAPIIAEMAREQGVLTVAVVTKPFTFEGRQRLRQAEMGIDELRERVDTLIVIPNQRLLEVVDKRTPLRDAFKIADNILCQAVQSISDLIVVPGLVNLDFADVRTIMSHPGKAIMGTGVAEGETRASQAAQRALESPLLEASVHGAKGVLINITGGLDMTLHEVHEAASTVQAAAHEEAHIIFGAVIEEQMEETLRVTLVATGFEDARVEMERRPRPTLLRRPLEPALTNGQQDEPQSTKYEVRETFNEEAFARWQAFTNNMSSQDAVGAPHDRSLDVPTFFRRRQRRR